MHGGGQVGDQVSILATVRWGVERTQDYFFVYRSARYLPWSQNSPDTLKVSRYQDIQIVKLKFTGVDDNSCSSSSFGGGPWAGNIGKALLFKHSF